MAYRSYLFYQENKVNINTPAMEVEPSLYEQRKKYSRSGFSKAGSEASTARGTCDGENEADLQDGSKAEFDHAWKTLLKNSQKRASGMFESLCKKYEELPEEDEESFDLLHLCECSESELDALLPNTDSVVDKFKLPKEDLDLYEFMYKSNLKRIKPKELPAESSSDELIYDGSKSKSALFGSKENKTPENEIKSTNTDQKHAELVSPARVPMQNEVHFKYDSCKAQNIGNLPCAEKVKLNTGIVLLEKLSMEDLYLDKKHDKRLLKRRNKRRCMRGKCLNESENATILESVFVVSNTVTICDVELVEKNKSPRTSGITRTCSAVLEQNSSSIRRKESPTLNRKLPIYSKRNHTEQKNQERRRQSGENNSSTRHEKSPSLNKEHSASGTVLQQNSSNMRHRKSPTLNEKLSIYNTRHQTGEKNIECHRQSRKNNSSTKHKSPSLNEKLSMPSSKNHAERNEEQSHSHSTQKTNSAPSIKQKGSSWSLLDNQTLQRTGVYPRNIEHAQAQHKLPLPNESPRFILKKAPWTANASFK